MKVDHTILVPESGVLSTEVRRFFASWFKLHAGAVVRVQLSRAKRSARSNRYYWVGVNAPIMRAVNEAGYRMTSEDVHEWLKKRHLPIDMRRTPTGDEYYTRSTRDLSQDEFNEWIDKIMSDDVIIALGVWIDSPEQYARRHGEPIKYVPVEDPE